MSDPSAKTGPLTAQDIQTLWEGAADPAYVRPLEEAGDGYGLEVWGQLFAQFARASQAVDVTFQSLFVLSWSGQTNPPAAGGSLARVLLTFSRGIALVQHPILIEEGVFVEEAALDWSPDGPVPQLTGRRYQKSAAAAGPFVFFFPGQSSQLAEVGALVTSPGADGGGQSLADAEAPGYGYNNPWSGTITSIVQPGTSYSNVGANVSFAAGVPGSTKNAAVVTAANEPDMFLPDHVGQYVQLTAGANAGVVARVTQYFPPQPSLNLGSGVKLEQLVCFLAQDPDITFVRGEYVQVKTLVGNVVVGEGYFLAERDVSGSGPTIIREVAFRLTSGVVDLPDPVTGATCYLFAPGSNSFGNVTQITSYPTFTPETGTASWRVLDWLADLSVTVQNLAQPSGGVAPMLDALGAEKDLRRSFGEPDLSFRQKVATPADTVSPNAIRRALNRILDTTTVCFREVGSTLLPGFFYDKTGLGDFYDWPQLLFKGTPSGIGAFSTQEHLYFKDAGGNIQAEGYYGGVWGGGVIGLVYKWANPRVLAGNYLVGDFIGSANPSNPHQINTLTFVSNSYDAANRHRYYLSFADMRAFFLVGLPRPAGGEFGFAYDSSPLALGFYDMTGYGSGFYDGYPLASAALYKQLWDDLVGRVVGGVGFDFEIEDIGCN